MKQVSRIGLAALVLALAPASVRADQIRWGYDWVAFPGEVPIGKSKVVFSDEPYHTAAGSSRVVAASLSAISTTDAARPDLFGPSSGYYALALGLQDLASGQWGALFFQGQLQGYLSAGNSAVTNRVIGPTTQSLELGDTRYTVTLDTFSPPGAPGAQNQGGIGALVEVTSIRRETPEPSALLLAGLGMAIGGLWWRRQGRGGAGSTA